ncbi:MAG: hypothetical protein FD170_2244 [Bacteroidetes bacterium]|nr:MAG: hypothetical protein FD170_2244 [Bacteroidota bacterium]
MNSLKQFIVALLIVLAAANAFSQNTATSAGPVTDTLSADELATFQKQATQLVGFMEFAFNTLGSPKSEYRDKDIIINQSFLKFFRDGKVQVEDDLVEKRDVVTNKDIQAYLKDIDFFFREVTFKYTVEEITTEVNEKGETYFKVKSSRNLKGKTIEGKDINENRPRFIEINLDKASRGLKIVSIYTTRSSEEQELMAWWNALDDVWRNYFASETILNDGLKMSFIQQVGRDYLLVKTNNNLPDSLQKADTIKTAPASLLAEVRKLWRLEQMDISGLKGIYDLEPLSAFTMLKHLNISGARVTELGPIRNLSKLESLNASSTLITTLDPVQYTTGLRNLDISSTFVTDITPVGNFKMLEFLNLSDTPLENIALLRELTGLRELKISRVPLKSLDGLAGLSLLETLDMSGIPLSDISALEGMDALQRIYLTKTYVNDVIPLAAMPKLQYIYLDYTPVNNIAPLLKLPDLKVIYCDKSMIGKQAALTFIQSRPEVKVIYESEELSVWWETLAEAWKSVFSNLVEVQNPPLREQLYEISNLRKIDISGNAEIQTLAPLRKLPSLSNLDASSSGIQSVLEIKDLPDLKELNISKTAVIDLTPLSGITGLNLLNISDTKAIDISPIGNLRNLQRLEMDNVQAASVNAILNLTRLEKLFADGVPAVANTVEKIWDSIPDLLVVYQSAELVSWWGSLPASWKQVFAEIDPYTGTPDREQLHRITSIKELDISRNRDISSLMPVSQLRKLEVLRFSGTQVADVLPVGLIKRVKELDCSNTPVSDLSPLTTNSGLEILNCSNTPVKDIDPLEFLTKLNTLDISGTQVTRLNALSSSSALVQLSCFNTRISSLKPIENLMSLKLLRIYNTRISEKNVNKFKEKRPGVEVVYY